MQTAVLSNTGRAALNGKIADNVKVESNVYTDAHPSYRKMTTGFVHQVIDHAENTWTGRSTLTDARTSGAC